jgi:hypothetical protein
MKKGLLEKGNEEGPEEGRVRWWRAGWRGSGLA